MVSSISSSALDGVQLAYKLKETFLKNFTESYDKTDSKKSKELDEKVKSLIDEADKDHSGGLSKEEISSIDTANNPEQAKLVYNLMNNFDTYDKNDDEQLSITELKDALKELTKQFSQQEIAQMAKENEKFSNSEYSFLAYENNLSRSLSEKLINNYKISDLTPFTPLTSSLNVEY